MMYLTFFKNFNRDLTYNRLKYKEQDLIQDLDKNHPYLSLIVTKHKNLFQHKYDFYNEQLRTNIIPKILNVYAKR